VAAVVAELRRQAEISAESQGQRQEWFERSAVEAIGEFFGPALRYIVLDEIHLYTGTLAAGTTLLLRRVRDRCQVAPARITHIATSATINRTTDD
jgi:ATP-dependent helicase YprA (DUF1998 family)